MAVSLGTRPSTITNQPGWTITKVPTSLYGSWSKVDMECLKVSVKMVSNAEDGPESLIEKDLAFSQWPSLGSPVNRFDQHVGCEASTMSSTNRSAKSGSEQTATTASSTPSSISTFLSKPYRTVIHHAHRPVGHPTTSQYRHTVSSKTRRLPSVTVSPIHHSKTSATTTEPLHRSAQEHGFPLSISSDISDPKWRWNGRLGISETELDQLKRKRRQERAMTQRIKQSLRGEIDSWDVDLGNICSVDWNNATSSSSTEGVAMETSTSHGREWSGWDSASETPISDEEWGEDWNWGGDLLDYNELMVSDDTPELPWWEQKEDAVVPTEDGGGGCNDDSTLDRHLMTNPGSTILNPLPIPVSRGFQSPLPSSNITLTPISPTLSPKLPSAATIPDAARDSDIDIAKVQDETLFLTFSTFGLNTPTRKRPHASGAFTSTEDIQPGSGSREHGDSGCLDEGLALHIKKKPFVRSCRI